LDWTRARDLDDLREVHIATNVRSIPISKLMLDLQIAAYFSVSILSSRHAPRSHPAS
jgi:hypothetical protein